MTCPRYIVWTRSPDLCFRIWYPEHFAALGIEPPGPGDANLRYAGDDYHAALRATFEANAEWRERLCPRPAVKVEEVGEAKADPATQPQEPREVQGMPF